jgi:hypothetical protein
MAAPGASASIRPMPDRKRRLAAVTGYHRKHAIRLLSGRGADWHADAYHRSPDSKCLLTLFGGKHGLGGIAGYDAAETNDEDPDRLAVVQRLTWAYLRSALYADDPVWSESCKALADHASSQGRVECK